MIYFMSAEVRITEQAVATSAVVKNCCKMVRDIFHSLPALTAGTKTHEAAPRIPSSSLLSLCTVESNRPAFSLVHASSMRHLAIPPGF
jgi:hypothetical protein